MGCGAKELGIFGDAAGVWNFLVAFREASWNFPRQDHDFYEFRGFSGIDLGIFRVAKSSGEGRSFHWQSVFLRKKMPSAVIYYLGGE